MTLLFKNNTLAFRNALVYSIMEITRRTLDGPFKAVIYWTLTLFISVTSHMIWKIWSFSEAYTLLIILLFMFFSLAFQFSVKITRTEMPFFFFFFRQLIIFKIHVVAIFNNIDFIDWDEWTFAWAIYCDGVNIQGYCRYPAKLFPCFYFCLGNHLFCY